jgi:hypothetical protein
MSKGQLQLQLQLQKQQQISPLRRQNAPSSVEMTRFRCGEKRTNNDNCKSKSRFLHSAAKAPPSVEMTGFGL